MIKKNLWEIEVQIVQTNPKFSPEMQTIWRKNEQRHPRNSDKLMMSLIHLNDIRNPYNRYEVKIKSNVAIRLF